MAEEEKKLNNHQHGGARPNAGRKKKLDKHAHSVDAAEKQIRDRLPEIVDAQLKLALGGEDIVTEKWQPAGLVTTGSGEFTSLVFPDLPADEMVLVERTITKANKDRAAGQYLINRILGSPTQKVSMKFEKMSDAELIEFIAGETTGDS